MLFAAATGERPCEIEETTTDADGWQTERAADPIRHHRRVPAAFAAVVDGCLAPDPAGRPTVAEVSRALTDLVEGTKWFFRDDSPSRRGCPSDP